MIEKRADAAIACARLFLRMGLIPRGLPRFIIPDIF